MLSELKENMVTTGEKRGTVSRDIDNIMYLSIKEPNGKF